MWWCHWTCHTWFPIDMYINYMTNSHSLALIAAQKVFSNLLSLGPNYENRKCTEWPQKDLELKKAKGTQYIYYNKPPVPNLTPFCSTIARFPDNWGFWFLHRLQWWIWNFRKKFVKNQKLKISKIPKLFLWGPLGGKFRTSFKTFGCDF